MPTIMLSPGIVVKLMIIDDHEVEASNDMRQGLNGEASDGEYDPTNIGSTPPSSSPDFLSPLLISSSCLLNLFQLSTSFPSAISRLQRQHRVTR